MTRVELPVDCLAPAFRTYDYRNGKLWRWKIDSDLDFCREICVRAVRIPNGATPGSGRVISVSRLLSVCVQRIVDIA